MVPYHHHTMHCVMILCACRSLACGCLKHSPTVCIYTLPPEGPSKVDLMTMSVLWEWVPLLPVITGAASSESGDTSACQQLMADMLQQPESFMPGLPPIGFVR